MRARTLCTFMLPLVLAIAVTGCTSRDSSADQAEPATVVAPEVPMNGERFEFHSAQPTRFARGVILQKLDNRTWVTVGEGRTGADGRFRFTLRADGILTLRALSPATTHQGRSYAQTITTPVTVRSVDQSVRLTAASSSALSLSAVSYPVRPGRTVTLQQREGAIWADAGTGRVDTDGHLTLRLPRPRASIDYRVRMSAWNGAPALTSAGVSVTGTDPRADHCTRTVLSIVAHQDDEILFMNPDIQKDLDAGACATTVYLTAGDSGDGDQYWRNREIGPEMAYSTMTGMDAGPGWTDGERTFAGHRVHVSTSPGSGRITLYSLRLPDGALDGTGTRTTGNQSVIKLLDNRIRSITPLDGSRSYDRAGLIATVRAIAESSGATTVRILDPRSGQGDHADHMASARVALEALGGVRAPVLAYRGYGITSAPANVTGKALARKTAALLSYAAYDPELCGPAATCPSGDTARWVQRQYRAPRVSPG
ncbi:PIG-L family deacetylase [Acidipropionibacterium virtanenii]|uniref:GlcNAc-PI de-N-acetylase n=1 Tax=Acidipropionibacterium virtanenii TaxID=2057246 RepID=A0A344UTU5_9ACTN|nr:PIG-L family deacetylase [Acidipropionibacterium virtanenii]AXE38693.1 hypothetical protein JS278_01529 [Acidipropionibacterium virtanenii]